ncbi:hypothetical protein [Roseibium sp.]|uniref:hypothetical protein n=1 Tax=Roseibium sp. TaxID=1936156 RepID=UPI003BAAE751
MRRRHHQVERLAVLRFPVKLECLGFAAGRDGDLQLAHGLSPSRMIATRAR